MRKSLKYLAKALHLIRLYRGSLVAQAVRQSIAFLAPAHSMDAGANAEHRAATPTCYTTLTEHHPRTHIQAYHQAEHKHTHSHSLHAYQRGACRSYTLWCFYCNYSFRRLDKALCVISYSIAAPRQIPRIPSNLIITLRQVICRCLLRKKRLDVNEIGFTTTISQYQNIRSLIRHQWSTATERVFPVGCNNNNGSLLSDVFLFRTFSRFLYVLQDSSKPITVTFRISNKCNSTESIDRKSLFLVFSTGNW